MAVPGMTCCAMAQEWISSQAELEWTHSCSSEMVAPIALPILSWTKIAWTSPIGPVSPMSNN
jgi:hypothetical protein